MQNDQYPVEEMAKETYEGVRRWLRRQSGMDLYPWDAEDEWLKNLFRRAQRNAVQRMVEQHRPVQSRMDKPAA